MKLQYAIVERIEELRRKHNMTKYGLFKASGVPLSTITALNKEKSRTVKLSTLYAICEGFEISLEEFFACPLFQRENIID